MGPHAYVTRAILTARCCEEGCKHCCQCAATSRGDAICTCLFHTGHKHIAVTNALHWVPEVQLVCLSSPHLSDLAGILRAEERVNICQRCGGGGVWPGAKVFMAVMEVSCVLDCEGLRVIYTHAHSIQPFERTCQARHLCLCHRWSSRHLGRHHFLHSRQLRLKCLLLI